MKAQEYLDKYYPKEERTEGRKMFFNGFHSPEFENLTGSFDLVGFVNLETLSLCNSKITSLTVTDCPKLGFISVCCLKELTTLSANNNSQLEQIVFMRNNQPFSLNLNNNPNLQFLDFSCNQLTSVDFLTTLSNPEKIKNIVIFNNDFEPTNIEFFSRFKHIELLKIGVMKSYADENKRNKFHGSLESWKDLDKLRDICIEATDVDSGLEYLPNSLVEYNKKSSVSKYKTFECSPHNTDAKVSQIQNELRPFNYDIEAWQLANPHKMYDANPKLFFDSELKSKWTSALRDKTNKTQEKLNETKINEPQAIKRIKRLEMKLKNLKLIQDNISSHSLIEKLQQKKETVDKQTQTEWIIKKN